MIYSTSNPAYVKPDTYNEIEKSLERWYNSHENPFRNIFINARRMSQKDVAKKFHLVIKDSVDNPDKIVVELVSVENEDYKPFSEVFDRI